VLERGEREELDDGALELADVRPDMVGDEVEHLVRDRVLEVVHLRLAAEDRDAVLEVRRPDIGDHSPGETGGETCLELRDFGWGPVRGEDDLAPRLIKGVERMEELLLRGVLTADEVDVIDEEEIGLAVAAPEIMAPFPIEVMTSLVNCSVVM